MKQYRLIKLAKSGKRVLSVVLCFTMLITSFCFFDIGSVISDAWMTVTTLESKGRPTVSFYVPETIYLKYGTNEIQYYVDNAEDGGVLHVPDSTTGKITFTSSVVCSNIKVTCSGAATTGNIASTNGYEGAGLTFRTVLSNGVLTDYSATNNLIEWKCTYNAGGTEFETYAYTYVYNPYDGIIGGARSGKANGTTANGYFTVFSMVTGFHSIPSTPMNGGSTVNGDFATVLGSTEAGKTHPLLIKIGTNEQGTNLSYIPKTDKYYTNDEPPTNKMYVEKTNGGMLWLGYNSGSENWDQANKSYVTSGELTVDSSRYSNLNQIPNLQTIGYWGSATWTQDVYTKFAVSTTNGSSYEPFFAESSTLSENSVTQRQKYFSTRINAIVPSSSFKMRIKSFSHYDFNGWGTHNHNITMYHDISVTVVNKRNLRAAVQGSGCIAAETVNTYTDYTNFKNALRAAGKILGNPTSTSVEISNAYNSLNSYYTSIKTQTENNIIPDTFNGECKVKFYVPETIYLNPTDNQTFQYFYGVDANGKPAKNMTLSTAAGGAKVYFAGDGCSPTDVKITCVASSSDNSTTWNSVNTYSISTITVDGVARQSSATNSTGWSYKLSAEKPVVDVKCTAGKLTSAVTAGNYKFIRWTATYTLKGETHYTYAYSICYAPFRDSAVASTRCYNERGVEEDLQSMAWVSGIVSCQTNGDKTIYPTNFNPIVGKLNTPTNTQNDGGYPQNSTDANIKYYNDGAGTVKFSNRSTSNNNHVDNQAQATSPLATIIIDSERFSNLKYIPNLKFGFQISYSKEGDAAVTYRRFGWYLTNYSDSYPATTAAEATGSYDNTFYYSNRYAEKYIASNTSKEEGSVKVDRSYCKPGLCYNGVLDMEITSARGVAVKGAAVFGTKRNGAGDRNSYSYNSNIVLLYANLVNKSSLRKTYEDAVNAGRQNFWYTDATQWNNYQNSILLAAVKLASPNNADVSSEIIIPTAKYSGSALASHRNNKTGEVIVTDSGNQQEFKTYGYGDIVSAGNNNYTGYTYANCSRIDSVLSLADWKNKTGSFKTLTGGKLSFNENKGEVTFTTDATVEGESYTGHGNNTLCYSMPVTPGEVYKFSYDGIKTSGSAGSEMFLLAYNSTDSATSYLSAKSIALNSSGTSPVGTFTVPAGANQIQMRLDVNGPSTTWKFSNIRIYKSTKASDSDTSVSNVKVPCSAWTFNYTPNEYTVTYNMNGGTIAGVTGDSFTETATYDSPYTVRGSKTANPTKTGYKFGGWKYEAGDKSYQSGYVFNPWKNDFSMTLDAIWIPNSFTLVYKKNDLSATGADKTVTGINFDTELKTLTEAESGFAKTDYIIAAWGSTTGTEYNAENSTPTGQIVKISDIAKAQGKADIQNSTLYLYAKWKLNLYKLMYENEFDFDAFAKTVGVKNVSNTSKPTAEFECNADRNTFTMWGYLDGAENPVGRPQSTNSQVINLISGHTYEFGYTATNNGTAACRPKVCLINNSKNYYLNASDVNNNLSVGATASVSTKFVAEGDLKATFFFYIDKENDNSGLVNDCSAIYSDIYLRDVTDPLNIMAKDGLQTSAPNPIFDDKICNQQVGSLATISRKGYTFKGWFTSQDSTGNGTGSKYTSLTVMPDRDVRLYARWSVNRFRTLFNLNRNAVDRKNLLGVAKYDYASDTYTPLTSTVTNSVNGITVSYDTTTSVVTLNGTPANGALSTELFRSPISITQGKTYTLRATVVGGSVTCASGKAFRPVLDAFYFDEKGNEKNVGNDYSSRFVLDVADEGTNVINKVSTSVRTATAETAKAQYIKVWMHSNDDFANTQKCRFNNLKIRFEIVENTASEGTSAAKNTEQSPNAVISNYYSTTISFPVPTRDGYSFNGWFTAPTGGTQVKATDVTPDNDRDLYAHWTANTYTLKINPNNGSIASGAVKVSGSTALNTSVISGNTASTAGIVTYDQVITLPIPTKSGWTFDGWVMSIGTLANASNAVYGTTDNPTTAITVGTSFASLANPVYLKNLSKANGDTVTLTAKWHKEISAYFYRIDNASGNKTVMEKKSVTIYDAATSGKVTATTPLGFTFDSRTFTWVGWRLDSVPEAATKTGEEQTISGVQYFRAIYSANVNLKYNKNTTGTVTNMPDNDSRLQYVNATATVSTTETTFAKSSPTFTVKTNVPVYTNWIFKGWSTDRTSTNGSYGASPKNSTISIDVDTTLYAIWSREKVVTFHYVYGSTHKTVTASATAHNGASSVKIVVPTIPDSEKCTVNGLTWTKRGFNRSAAYVANGWTSEGSTITVTLSSTTEYYMNYTSTVTLTTKSNGGNWSGSTADKTAVGTSNLTATSTSYSQIGANISTAAVPNRANCKFVGYSTSSAGTPTHSASKSYQFYKNTTLYAIWCNTTDIDDSIITTNPFVQITKGVRINSKNDVIEVLKGNSTNRIYKTAEFTNYQNAVAAYNAAKTALDVNQTVENGNALLIAVTNLKKARAVLESIEGQSPCDYTYFDSFVVKNDKGTEARHNVGEMNLNHYKYEVLDAATAAKKNGEHIRGSEAITYQATVNGYVETMARSFVATSNQITKPIYNVIETPQKVSEYLTGSSTGVTAVNYVFNRLAGYTFYCYVNTTNPKVVINLDEVTAGTSNRAAYPTTLSASSNRVQTSASSGAKADLSYKMVLASNSDNKYTNYTNEGVGTEVSKKVAKKNLGSAETTETIGGADYYKMKQEIVLSPTFDKYSDKSTATYKFISTDDALTTKYAETAKLAGKEGEINVLNGSLVGGVQKENLPESASNMISICICYHSGEVKTDSTTGKKTIEPIGVTAMNIETDVWISQFHLFRTSGGASNVELPKPGEYQSDAADGYRKYTVNDPVYGQSDYGSFTYTFLSGTEGYDDNGNKKSVINITPVKDPNTASVTEANTASNIQKVQKFIKENHNKLKEFEGSNTYKVDYMNPFAQEAGKGLGYYTWSQSGWSYNYYPRAHSYTYVHLVDRWGNTTDAIFYVDKIDCVHPVTINMNGIYQTTNGRIFIDEDGGSHLSSVDFGATNFTLVTDDNSSYSNGVYRTSTNVITMKTGASGKSYTLKMEDKAGNLTTETVKSDSDGYIVLTVEDPTYYADEGAYTFLLNGNVEVQMYYGADKYIKTVKGDRVEKGKSAEISILTSGKVDKVRLTDENGLTTTKNECTVQNTDGTKTWKFNFSKDIGEYKYKVTVMAGGKWIDENRTATITVVPAEEKTGLIRNVSYNAATGLCEVTASARADKIQFIATNGTTLTFDRHMENVNSITSYDKAGKAVNSQSRVLDEEKWVIKVNLTKGTTYTVAGKIESDWKKDIVDTVPMGVN